MISQLRARVAECWFLRRSGFALVTPPTVLVVLKVVDMSRRTHSISRAEHLAPATVEKGNQLAAADHPRDTGAAQLIQRLGQQWAWAAFPILLFISTRIALLGFSQIGMSLASGLFWEYRAQPFMKEFPALDGLCRWDCEHFGIIARSGYTEAWRTNFFPLFPSMALALHKLTGMQVEFAMLVVSNLAGLGAYLAIYQIFTMLADESSARWGLMLFAAYPFAFFQAAAYPESLMICSTSIAILLALRGHHILAGFVLGYGVLTRHLTLFAGAGLLAAQIRQRGFHPQRFLLNPAILGLALPWLFLALYCLYQYTAFGDPLAFAHARSNWGPLAWWGIDDLLRARDGNEHVQVMYAYLPFGLLITAGAIALCFRREWIELAAFAIVFMLAVWSIGVWGMGRYTAACWPAFLPLGVWLSKWPILQGPAIGLFAVFQGLFFFLFSHQFVIL